jgi:hypothetical protein
LSVVVVDGSILVVILDVGSADKRDVTSITFVVIGIDIESVEEFS